MPVRKHHVLVLFVAIAISAFAVPSNQTQNTIKEKYRNLEVGAFTIDKGVELPADLFTALPQEIVSQMQEKKVFDKVSAVSDANAVGNADAGVSVLRMTGVVTAFHPGSRKGRYFGGAFNPGAYTQIYATIQFVDATTNALIDESDVVGTLSGGFGGGDSKNVVKEFAESLVETTKYVVLKAPLAHGEGAPKIADDAVQETVELSDSGFNAAQAKVNELAGKGYRLARFRVTSYQTAELLMAKVSETGKYEYLLYRAMLPSNVQKELTKRSADGYRYRPHTVTMLKNKMFVIAERESSASPINYEYRVHATMLQSSAENNVREDQAQGFTLIDSRKTMENHHVLLLEKRVEK